MELITRTFRTVRRLLTPNGWFTLGIVLALITLEAIGRQMVARATDLYDALLACFLGSLTAMVVYRHRSTPLAWAARCAAIGRRAYEWFWSWGFELGIDMRGTPPVKRGYPPGLVCLALVLLTWLAALLTMGNAIPHELRQFGGRFFYLGYLLVAGLLWTLLVGGILLAFFIPMAMIHDAFVHAHTGPRRRIRQPEMATLAFFFFVLMVAGWFVPLWVLLAACALALVVNGATTFLPANARVQFLWRPRNSIQVRSIRWSHWVSCEFTLITLAIFDLVLTACGPQILTGNAVGKTAMPFTAMLGTVLAWLAPGLLGAMVWQSVLGRWRDPARRCPVHVHVLGEVTEDAKKVLRSRFQARGWIATFAPANAVASAVVVDLVRSELSQAQDFDPEWPLKLSREDLDDERVLDRLLRRHEIQARRHIVSALERLFKRVTARKYGNGHGFWVAPHFWFIAGLTRDAQEEEVDLAETPMLSATVGPAFHRVMPRAARHHLYVLMRALHVDLIFVEDGVKFRRFVKVLRRMFEIYDKNDGKKPAEDIHFVGLPGTRVLIHEFQLDEPFTSTTYPEPKYDYLGRARILHVFRDRNEQEELIEPPFDITRTPAPLMGA